MRISLDLFNTRNKENQFLELALSLQQRVTVDNTNVTKEERQRYIGMGKANKYSVVGYFFESILPECIKRNENRSGKDRINTIGVVAKYKSLEPPLYTEGFDELYSVRLKNNQFIIKQPGS